MVKYFLVLVIAFVSVFQSAQSQDSSHVSGEDIIESILDNASDEQEMQNYGDELEYFRDHPLNIVNPNYSELIKLPFISPLLAESIILFTDTVQITSVEQIRSVSLMTQKLFDELYPFIKVESPTYNYFDLDLSSVELKSRSRLERRLQIQKGFKEQKYLGDRNGIYQRTKISNKKMELAALAEKDIGESSDYGLLAGYISVKDISFVNNLVLGNYHISSGQGLVLAKNISASNGTDVIGQIRKRGRVISPSASTDEYRYFQGIASHVDLQEFSLTGFYSERKLPAAIDSNGISTSIFTSGIYRTTNDLKRRNTLEEKTIGGKLDYKIDEMKTISLNMMNVEYGTYIKPTLFDLKGKKSLVAGSVSWEIPFSEFVTFGEAATNDAERFSKVFGIALSASESFAVSYHYRAYTKGYTSPFARPFGERDNISDGETGNYVGIEIRGENFKINSFIDQYNLPSTENGFGLNGRAAMLYVQKSVSRQLEFIFQIRNKTKTQTEIHFTDDDRVQTNYRIGYRFKATSRFSLSQRFEFINVSYNPSRYKEEGFLTFIEGLYKNHRSGLTLKSRLIFFDTRSYDSRLYQYESDVAGNYSNPPIYDKGVRWYIVGAFEIFNKFSISCRYSETKKLDEIVLGSGDDEIQGNVDNQISVQMDFEF